MAASDWPKETLRVSLTRYMNYPTKRDGLSGDPFHLRVERDDDHKIVFDATITREQFAELVSGREIIVVAEVIAGLHDHTKE